MNGGCARRYKLVPQLALGLFVLASGIVPPAVRGQDAADSAAPVVEAMVQAEAAIQEREPQLAESLYRTSLLEGWLLMGALGAADSDWAAAQNAYEAAMSSAVETRRARLSLAVVHIRGGAPEKAILVLRKVIGKDLRDAQARRLLSQALAADGQPVESALELESLREMYPDDPETTFLLATAYLNQQRLEDAEPLFAELATARPAPQTHVLIGRTYRDFEYYDLARRSLNRALEMDPEIPRAHYYLGTVDYFEFGEGGLGQAIDQFEAELRISAEDPSTNLHLGMALVQERRQEEAIEHLELASRHPALAVNAFHFLGRAYLRVGREEDASVVLRRALEIAEADPRKTGSGVARRERQITQLHYQLALALRRLGDEEAAAPHFEAAKDAMARETEDSRERLRRYLEDESVRGSLEVLTSPLASTVASDLSPEERAELRATLTYRLAQCYMNLGVLQAQRRRLPRAADLFQQAADLVPDLPQLQYSLGVARFNSGQFEQATEPLSQAAAEDPDNLQLRRMLALAWLNSKSYDRAAKLLEDDPGRGTDRSLQYAYGVALVRSGQAAEAERVFAELLVSNQDWPELHVVLGLAAAQQDDFDAAIQSLERAIELKPDVAEAHSTLGDIHMRHGRLEEAESELRTELDHRPNDLQTQYLLATVLEMAGDSKEALELLDSVLAAEPQAANARYLKGKILLAQGDAESALIQLETAARLNPGDPEVHYQLGIALQRQGRAEEARSEFEIYQSLKHTKNTGGS